MQEEVEDVQVEVDGRQDVVFGGESVHHHVGVEDDEHGEEGGPSHRNRLVHEHAREEQLKQQGKTIKRDM